MRYSPRALLLLLPFAACLLLAGPNAAAQLGAASENKGSASNKLEAPSPTFKAEEGGEYIPYLWGAVIIILAIGVNFIPTKRGHQD